MKYQKEKQKQIAFDKDILEELAERMDMDIKVVEKNVEFIHQYLFKISRDPEVTTIKLPHLGNMYFKPYTYLHAKKNAKKKEEEKKVTFWEWAGEKTNKLFSLPEWKDQGLFHKKRSKLALFYMTKGLSYKELEEHQNKDFNEKS